MTPARKFDRSKTLVLVDPGDEYRCEAKLEELLRKNVGYKSDLIATTIACALNIKAAHDLFNVKGRKQYWRQFVERSYHASDISYYLAIARNPYVTNPANWRDLPGGFSVLYPIARLTQEDSPIQFQRRLIDNAIHPRISRNDVNALLEKKRRLQNAMDKSLGMNVTTNIKDNVIHIGDALAIMKTLPGESVHCIVTSPPYFALRNYEVEGQLGSEATPELFIEHLVAVLHEAKRVLRSDGTLWLVLGDSSSSGTTGRNDGPGNCGDIHGHIEGYGGRAASVRRSNLPPKNLLGIPWRVALALQADGWFLRNDIIWSKPTVMPESAKDRCTRSHDYIFLLSKSEKYYFDLDAIAEPTVSKSHRAFNTGGPKALLNHNRNDNGYPTGDVPDKDTRNPRDVWEIMSVPSPETHFAVFPPELPRRCILAGCPEGGSVMDCFAGTCTTGIVAVALGRKSLMIELNPEYAKLMDRKFARVLSKPGIYQSKANLDSLFDPA